MRKANDGRRINPRRYGGRPAKSGFTVIAAGAVSLLAALAAPFMPVFAQETAPKAAAAPQIDPQRIIARADADKDGNVSKAEFTALRTQMASRLDRNNDGVIDAKDAERFRRRRANLESRIREVSRGFDLNGDGVIEVEEFINGPTLVFDMVDADGNGIVSAAELEAAHAAFEARQAAAETARAQ